MKTVSRENAIDEIALRWTNDADIKTLSEHFYNEQYEWLNSMSDEELQEIANEQGLEITS